MSKQMDEYIKQLRHTMLFVLFMQFILAGCVTLTLMAYLNEIADMFLQR